MDIRTVIIGGTPNMLLAGWLKRKGLQYGVGYSDESGEIARNREAVDFLAGSVDDESMLFLLDADIAPGPDHGLDSMLTEPGELIYCGHPARSLQCGHFGDGNLATGCMRATWSFPRWACGRFWLARRRVAWLACPAMLASGIVQAKSAGRQVPATRFHTRSLAGAQRHDTIIPKAHDPGAHGRSLMKSLTAVLVFGCCCVAAEVSARVAAAADQQRTGRVHDTGNNPFMTIKQRYGDPFPVCFDGVWHLYTLQSGLGSVRHLTSTDLVTWTEHKPAMTGGGIATGIVLRHKGTYYMFYTIGQRAIGLVTSDNPWFFDKKKSKTVAKPDPKFYPAAGPFRDVSVFRNEEEGLWWMLFEAHVRAKGVQVGLYKAEHLEGPWKPHRALYTQPGKKDKLNRFVSCPQIIKHGDTSYLTYLSSATSYHTADKPSGPWGQRKGQYNSDFLTAGSRSGTDGKRRLTWGFFTVRPTPENPKGRPRYGGPLGVGREMVFLKDKTIGVRPLPELVAAIRKPANNAKIFPLLKRVAGTWEFDPRKQQIKSTDEKGGTALIDLPEGKSDYYFETDVDVGDNKTAVSVTVRGSAKQDRGYRIALRPRESVFEITEHTGQRRSYLTETHRFGKTVNLKIFICEGQLEAFVDGRSDLSTRVLDRSGSKIILEAEGGKATFSKPLVHYFKRNTPARPIDKPVPDIRSVKPDLVVPRMVEGKPGPGRRVKQTTAGYVDTKVYHALYLPVDWQPKKRYPVIVEYAGNGPFKNRYGDVSTGKVEGSNMGYGISGGKGVIWVCMPYLNGSGAKNVTMWWGNRPRYQVQPTIDYCLATVKMICERYGGDSTKVFLAGFSRGSIACNYIGLHNDKIASLWRGFICYANYDGLHALWPYPGDNRASAAKRLQRLGQRPQFICQEVVRKAKDALSVTRAYLKQAYPDGKFTFELIPFRNHNDAWTLRDLPARRALRKWFAGVLAAGTAGAAESAPKELTTPNTHNGERI